MLWLCLALLLPATLAADVDQVPGELAGRRVVEIELLGYRHTRVHVIQRELRTRVGQPLSPATPAADLQRLGNLDIFSSVRVQLVAEGAEAVRVTYHLRELAAGSTLCHLRRHRSGWLVLWTRSEVGEPLGRDIFLAGYALFGGRTSYLLDLTHPWMFGDHVSLDLDASRIVRQNDFDGFEETSTEFTPRLGTWLGDHGRAAVAFSYLRFESDLPGHTMSATDSDDLLRVGGSAGYDSRDDWSNPTHGWWAEAEAWKTGGILPGDGDFWTLNLDGRRFQPAVRKHPRALEPAHAAVRSGRPRPAAVHGLSPRGGQFAARLHRR